jgi:DNA-binding transcriptional MocR family regulator
VPNWSGLVCTDGMVYVIFSFMTIQTLVTDIPLDKQSEEPIYQQLIRHFQVQIASGRLQQGTRLPPSRDLARQLGIGRISVVSAYNELQARGLISAHPGRGTFVNGPDAARQVAPPSHPQPLAVPYQNVREIMRLAEKPGIISFNSGMPPPEFLPIDDFHWAINAVFQRDGVSAMTYEEAEGYMPLRQATRDFVTSQGIDCRAENILITGGAQQAIDLVIQSLLNQGDILLTTNPTYIGVLDIAHIRRVAPMGLPVDEDGIRLDVLEDVLIEHRPKLLYINPSFSNPNGLVMPIHRRRQLLRLAHEYNLMILEDAVYHELHFDEAAPPPLKALDETGCVLHASGYSKILLPGTRIGYLIAEKNSARERIVQTKEAADICTPSFNQRVVHLYIKHGKLHGHLDRIRHVLRDRRDAAVEAAEEFLPEGMTWNTPKGGLYLWAELPQDGPTAAELYVTAIQHGVAYAIGSLFHPNGDGARFIRINFGSHPVSKIREGFRRLRQAWDDFQKQDVERKPIL